MKKILVSLLTILFFSAPLAFGLTIGDDDYLGYFLPSNQNEAGEAASINILIGGVETTVGGISYYPVSPWNVGIDYPLATSVDSFKDDSENNTGDFGSGYAYLLGKYAQTAHVWYVDGMTGSFTMPSSAENVNGPSSGGDLSHYTLFNPAPTQVPEPTTLLLFGAGIASLALYRRKRS